MHNILVKNVLKACESDGTPEKQMCRAAGIPFSSWWRVKQGGDIKLNTLKKIAAALGRTPSGLLRGEA